MYLQLLCCIQLYKNLSILLLVGIWVVSGLGPIINNTTMSVLVHPDAHVYVFLDGIYLGLKSLDQRVCICSTLLDATQFCRKIIPVYNPTKSVQHLIWSDLSFSANLIGIYPIVVLICASLMTKGRAPLFIGHLNINFCTVSIKVFYPFFYLAVCPISL